VRGALVLLALLVAVGRAAAQPPAPPDTAYREGRAHVEAGDRAFDAGDYRRAADEYLAAYQLIPLPDLLYNLGQCYRLADDAARAVEYYQRYLRVAPTGAAADKAREHIERLGGAVARDDGGEPPPPPASAPPSPPPEPVDGGSPARRWIALGTAGAGFLMAAGGATLWLSADRTHDRLERTCAPGCDESDWTGARTRERVGIALAATGLAVTAAGLVWWALTPARAGPAATAWVTPDAAGLALGGGF
jgi:tetratricopeptide (TPR) repeat protein